MIGVIASLKDPGDWRDPVASKLPQRFADSVEGFASLAGHSSPILMMAWESLRLMFELPLK